MVMYTMSISPWYTVRIIMPNDIGVFVVLYFTMLGWSMYIFQSQFSTCPEEPFLYFNKMYFVKGNPFDFFGYF